MKKLLEYWPLVAQILALIAGVVVWLVGAFAVPVYSYLLVDRGYDWTVYNANTATGVILAFAAFCYWLMLGYIVYDHAAYGGWNDFWKGLEQQAVWVVLTGACFFYVTLPMMQRFNMAWPLVVSAILSTSLYVGVPKLWRRFRHSKQTLLCI